jgi:ubiquinone/menaquinone biosynthesis C-methylase UbiE
MDGYEPDESRLDWRNVDSDPATAGRYLDLVADVIDEVRARATSRLGLVPGASVLEVGCGNGLEAERLAALVGPAGRVVATDLSGEMILQAQGRTRSLGLPIRFEVADAQALPYRDGEFDAARVERMLQHVPDPARVVQEMVRVVRPGGRVCAFEPDWETMVLATGGDNEIQRALRRHKVDIRTAHGGIGRELPHLFVIAGCQDISVEPVALGVQDLALADSVLGLSASLEGAVAEGWVSEDAARAWWEQAQARSAADGFYASMVGVIVAGRVP